MCERERECVFRRKDENIEFGHFSTVLLCFIIFNEIEMDASEIQSCLRVGLRQCIHFIVLSIIYFSFKKKFGSHVIHEQQHNTSLRWNTVRHVSIVLCISISVVCMTSRQGSVSFYAEAFNPRDSFDDNSVARMFARV